MNVEVWIKDNCLSNYPGRGVECAFTYSFEAWFPFILPTRDYDTLLRPYRTIEAINRFIVEAETRRSPPTWAGYVHSLLSRWHAYEGHDQGGHDEP